LRLLESLPSPRQLTRALRGVERARQERERLPLNSELWTSGDPPRSSMEPLAAVEAARLQGEPARAELLEALRRAALIDGVNVTRTDVVFELARAGVIEPQIAARFPLDQAADALRFAEASNDPLPCCWAGAATWSTGAPSSRRPGRAHRSSGRSARRPRPIRPGCRPAPSAGCYRFRWTTPIPVATSRRSR